MLVRRRVKSEASAKNASSDRRSMLAQGWQARGLTRNGRVREVNARGIHSSGGA